MSNKWKMTATRSNGIGFWELLQVALIVLKLVNVVQFSWWWVMAPTWIPLIIAIVVAVALALFDR